MLPSNGLLWTAHQSTLVTPFSSQVVTWSAKKSAFTRLVVCLPGL